jgi:uncharacterized protein YneR
MELALCHFVQSKGHVIFSFSSAEVVSRGEWYNEIAQRSPTKPVTFIVTHSVFWLFWRHDVDILYDVT